MACTDRGSVDSTARRGDRPRFCNVAWEGGIPARKDDVEIGDAYGVELHLPLLFQEGVAACYQSNLSRVMCPSRCSGVT